MYIINIKIFEKLMLKNGFTQTELSRKSCVCRTTLWKCKNGIAIKSNTASKIANALNVKAEILFKKENKK